MIIGFEKYAPVANIFFIITGGGGGGAAVVVGTSQPHGASTTILSIV